MACEHIELITIGAQEYRRLKVLRRRSRECRAAQSEYWKTRRREDLIAAKEAERRLDSVLRALELPETPGQEPLFSEEETAGGSKS